ncbi:MAG: hypothetical protein GX640_08545 [Fibrobacter sp.]|nr:hypothetical protein [Fibrobacter sp.]
MEKLVFLLIGILSTLSAAETHITGDITGMPLEPSGNPYIVEQDIHIPNGKKAIIKEGCVFLFKPFTGLLVQGVLLVEGTQSNPVVFTAINDGEYNLQSEQLPNPFDWNGILISRESSSVIFKNFKLQFSVYGIKSQNSAIEIENGLFKQNGQFHFTINDQIQYVQDNIPFSINITDLTKVKNISDNPVTQVKNEKVSNGIKVFRFVSLTVGAGCAVPALICGVRSLVSWNVFKNGGPYDDPERYPDPDKRTKIYNENRDDFFKSLPPTIVFSSIAVAGLTCFGISFAF